MSRSDAHKIIVKHTCKQKSIIIINSGADAPVQPALEASINLLKFIEYAKGTREIDDQCLLLCSVYAQENYPQSE